MSALAVSSLAVFPIKGCRAVALERAVVGRYGLAGDREWQVVDAELKPITQRTHPSLVRVQPSLVEGGIVLRAEGVADLEVARPMAADIETSSLIEPIKLGDAGDVAARWMADVLGVEGVRLLAIAPGYERRYPFFETSSSLGDAAPVVVATDASHAFLAERADEPFGPERWRINVFVAGASPFVEDTWRDVRMGDTSVRLAYPWPRCAVPQIDQLTGERHREPAVVLKAHRWCSAVDGDGFATAFLPGNALFGMAGSIVPEGGTIAVGDEVEVLDTAPALVPFASA